MQLNLHLAPVGLGLTFFRTSAVLYAYVDASACLLQPAIVARESLLAVHDVGGGGCSSAKNGLVHGALVPLLPPLLRVKRCSVEENLGRQGESQQMGKADVFTSSY